MSLPSFAVDFPGGLKNILYTLTSGELTEVPMAGLRIKFWSNIGPGEWITYAGVTYPATAPPVSPVVVTVEPDGTLSGSGDPVKLLANDPGLNVTGVQWSARADIPGRDMRTIVFDAGADGATLDLSSVVPVPPMIAAGIPVTMAMVDAAIAAAGIGGGGVPGVIDGGSAASSGAGVIDGGSA